MPSRNEEFLARTIQDLLENTSDKTEIIAVLDGAWSEPAIPQHPRVSVIYLPESVGQRKATNIGVRLSRAKYVAKADAHTSYDKDFDTKMIEGFEKNGDNVTMVAVMKNLHCYDWKCYKCGQKEYQDRVNICPLCKNTMRKKMVWQPRRGVNSVSYMFDTEPHFGYHEAYKHTSIYRSDVIAGYKLVFPRLLTSDLLKKVSTDSFDGSQPTLSTSIISLLTDFANSHHLSSGTYHFWGGEDMTVDAMSFSSIDHSGRIRTSEILGIGDKLKMDGIATPPVLTEVVKDGDVLSSSLGERGNKPSISDAVCELFLSELSTPAITPFINPAKPIPTAGSLINSDTIDKLNHILGGQFVYNEKTSSFHNGSVALIPLYDKKFTQTMSLQGSFYMMTREKYLKLMPSREEFGSWGNEGAEIACYTWLTGGRVLVNHNTWNSHMFRTKGEQFGFPYPQSGKHVSRTKQRVWETILSGRLPGQIHPVSWLIERFSPIPTWTPEKIVELKASEKALNVV